MNAPEPDAAEKPERYSLLHGDLRPHVNGRYILYSVWEKDRARGESAELVQLRARVAYWQERCERREAAAIVHEHQMAELTRVRDALLQALQGRQGDDGFTGPGRPPRNRYNLPREILRLVAALEQAADALDEWPDETVFGEARREALTDIAREAAARAEGIVLKVLDGEEAPDA